MSTHRSTVFETLPSYLVDYEVCEVPASLQPSSPNHPHFNLRPYEDIRHMRHAVLQLWDPFFLDVVVRGRIYDGEADQKHIGVGVGQWPQLVVVLLWKEQIMVCSA